MIQTPLAVRGVRKTSRRGSVLDDYDLELSEGESLALIDDDVRTGRSLFRLILGIERPDAGTIRVCGIDPVAESSRALLRVAYLPPKPDVPGWMRAKDYFDHLAVHFRDWDEDVTELLCEEWALPSKMKFRRMVAGDALRLQLAAALAYEPALLLIDRACEALASSGDSAALVATLAEFRDDGGAILCASSEVELIEGLCERRSSMTERQVGDGVGNDAV